MNFFHNQDWWVLTLKEEDVKNIQEGAKSISPFDKSPITEDRKLFYSSHKASKFRLWSAKKEEWTDQIPNEFRAKVKLELRRFTQYNYLLSYKLDVSDIMISETVSKVQCPF